MGIVAPPVGGLIGNVNYFITGNDAPIMELAVSIDITEDIRAPQGLSFQLNCWTPLGANTSWQQYFLMFAPRVGNQPAMLSSGIDNWPSVAYAEALKLPAGADMIKDFGSFKVIIPNTDDILPAGHRLTIILATDPNAGGNVTGVTFVVAPPQGPPLTGSIGLVGHAIQNLPPSDTIQPSALAPVYAVQMNIVGETDGWTCFLQSGAGTINYAADTPLSVKAKQPAGTQAGGTGEQSNVAYGELSAGPSLSITQAFSAALPQITLGACVVASQRFGAAEETDVLTVGPDGRLNLTFMRTGVPWTGPTAYGPADAAPSGARLAVSQQFGAGGQTDAFVVGKNGQLQVYSAKSSGGYDGPQAIGPAGFAPAGAVVAASQQFGIDNQTDVLVVDNNGQLAVFWVNGAGHWHGPEGIGPAGLAPAGAGLAVSQQFGCDNQTDVFVVDHNGQLNVFWVNGAGHWHGPEKIGPAGFAPPGSSLAASQQFGCDNQTDVFVVGNSGQLAVFWVENGGAWHGPVPISVAGFTLPGAALSACQQFGCDNQTDVFVVGDNGQVSVFWVENAGVWQGPVPIGLNQDAPAGASLAASQQFGSGNQTDLFFINNAGMLVAAWVESAGKWNGPIRLL